MRIVLQKRGGAHKSPVMAASRLFLLIWTLLSTALSSQQNKPSLPHFSEDTVYAYSYQSSTQISRGVSVDLTADLQISVLSSDEGNGGSQELHINIVDTQLKWSAANNGSTSDDNPIGNLNNWFSALREEDGSISTVLYPSGESLTVLAFKKTITGLFSVDVSSSSWSEGDDSVVLSQEKTETQGVGVGDKIVSKTTTIDAVSGAIVEVTVDEQIASRTQSEQTGTLMGHTMQSHSSLLLLSQHSSHLPTHRPHDLVRDDITITSLVRPPVPMDEIPPLLDCSSHSRDCVHQLEQAIQLLSEEDIATLLQQYIDESSGDFSLPRAKALLTTFSTSSPSPSTTHLLTSLLLPPPPQPLPTEQLVSNLLFYFTISLPVDEFSVEHVWSVVTDHGNRPSLQTQALLALGAMARRVRPYNHGLATQIVADLHHLLEQHTGYSTPLTLHKHKRTTIPTLPSSLPHSSLHALLLDCLANAGADESFPTLEHHMFFGDLSVRHAAIKAMSGYDTDDSADALLRIAESSSDDHHPSLIRAARSTYQTHSRRKRDLSDLPDLPDQYSGQTNSRLRRDSTSDDAIEMNVTMPTVGWNRQFGDSNISADLSRTVSNAFTISTTDQSSKYHFSFHDEMTLSSHLALSDGDSDFEIMRTQLCLEGTADYETINILTEFTPERTYQQYLLYRDASTRLVEGFEAVYDQVLSSNSAYDGTKDVLINELDDLIDVHFEDVITQLDDALSRLDDLPNEFSLKSDVWDIYSTLRDRATSNKASAQTAKEVILSALHDALPMMPEEFRESLFVDGQPFTTHSFHVPYLPFAPQKALVNILDVYRSANDAYDNLKAAVKRVIDLTSPNGPNHSWLSPSVRQISDDLTTISADIIKAINELPPESSEGQSLEELSELYDIVDLDLKDSLNLLVGVANDVIAQSALLAVTLEGSRKAFTAFTLSYDTARSTVDALLGQKFHPSFPRQRRSCDHKRGCGSYPTTSDRGYGEGVAVVMSDGEEIVAPLSGYYSRSSEAPPYDSLSTITLTPAEPSYHDLSFTLSHVLPALELTDSPIFIRGGDPLGIFIAEPQTQNTDEYYIHIEAFKTVDNETYRMDPTLYLQPIHNPLVTLQYDCNDLVTYIGGPVVDRRTVASDVADTLEFGAVLVEDTIPGHEFPRPVDHLLHTQGTILSGTTADVFSSSTFIMVGPIPVQFEFRAVGDYQLDYSLDFSLLSRQAALSVTPSLVSRAHGYERMGGRQYATITLEGTVLDASLPLSLRQDFLQWPLTASSQMDMVLSPSSLSLTSQLAQTTGAGEFTTEEILQTDTLWYYTIPSLNRDEFYYQGLLTDESPPQFTPLPYASSDCYIRQLAVGDFYSPLFEVEFDVSEPQGLMSTAYQVGSAPKTDDIIENSEIVGSRIVIPHQLIPASPIHVTVTATNLNGDRTLAMCSVPSYDRSPPLARISPIRAVSSHPSKIMALFSLFDEFGLDTPLQVAIGTVPGEYGDDVMGWMNFNLSTITTPPPENGDVLNRFSFKRIGRLLTEVHQVTPHILTPSECAERCITSTACRSFDHSPAEANCILHRGIEGPQIETTTIENVFQTPSLQSTSDYGHYERLGFGNSTVMEFSDLPLTHNTLYYINMRLVNGLGFNSVASSTPFLVDLTPPTPGNLHSVISDEIELTPCEDLSVGGLECIESSNGYNHRVIVDGPESAVVFNGHTPLVDAMYTSTTNYITANWDGLEDLQSGVHGYRWWVGSALGQYDVLPPTDPHMHLIGGQSAWTNSGFATGLNLTEGSYYITVQAISNIEYGGSLATTVHHSTPYILDTTPPQLNDVIITEYDTSTNQLVFSYNASDDQSHLQSVSLSLGRTEHDTAILGWTGVGTSGNGMVTVDIPDGVDTWVKLRAINNAGLSSIAVAETAIRVDRSPPLVATYGDGDDVVTGDVDFQRSTASLCVHAAGVTDPESGIAEILWEAGTTRGAQDIIPTRDITAAILTTGSDCVDGLSLLHNMTYYSTLYINNGAITSTSQTTTIQTDGVRVDTTRPLGGSVHTGMSDTLDAMYSSDITSVTASWDGFYDYESGIEEFIIDVNHLPSGGDLYEVIHTETVDSTVSELTWTHFSFANGDSITVHITASNGAGRTMQTAVSSVPYTIDLSPPHMSYLVDGSDVSNDLDYQSLSDQLTVSWDAEDAESAIIRVEITILEQFEGRRILVYPDPLVPVPSEEINATLGTYTLHDLSLDHGVRYITVITFTNGAGLISQFETNGIVVDTSPPLVASVSVEGVVATVQDTESGIVVVPSTEQVSVWWMARDTESDIAEILVGIVDENDTFVVPEMTSFPGHSSGGVLRNLNLDPGALYRVAVIAVNNAQTKSETTFSQFFRVEIGDTPGLVYDGEDLALIDVDYTDEATAVTVHFSGFSSTRCGGVSHYEWAVGEGWEEGRQETVMEFTERGIVVNWSTGSGYAQVLLPNLASYGSQPLFVTVRGITDCGDIVQSTSDGFVVDPSPPTLEVVGTGENAIEHAQFYNEEMSINHTTYQTNPSISTLWRLTDDQSGLVSSATVRIGTYLGGGDVQNETVTASDHIRSGLTGGEGIPHYVTVAGTNRAGGRSTASSKATVVDTSPPTLGQLICVLHGFPPPLPLPSTSPSLTPTVFVCEWSDIEDPESGITGYSITITDTYTEDKVVYEATLPGSATGFKTPSLLLNDTSEYTILLEATNGAGLQRLVLSEVALSNTVYAGLVEVVVNYARTENASGEFAQPEKLWSGEDFVCLLETNVISIVFNSPLSEERVDTDSFEVGVGYFPGTDDHHTFTTFTPSLLTAGTYSHTLTHIDTTTIGRRPVYITVQARSKDKTRQVFKLSSPPIYIKSDITEWDSWLVDGSDPKTDIEFQTSTTEISAYFSIGTHCPLAYARWSIEDANGTVVHEYMDVIIPPHSGREIDNSFALYTDQVDLYNEESYRVLLQAIDSTGEVFILRSNGLTVTTDELVPNVVQDGPIPNEDLNYQEPTDYLSAHWAEFGDGTPQQEIVYYEVAAGSNVGYPNTRTDIAPFTNVGLNTSHTFSDLDLIPENVMYYITVRATAISGAVVESSSNGIRVGLAHRIQPGSITLPPYTSSSSDLDVHWEEFVSNVPIRSYEWAIGETDFSQTQLQEMCSDYLSVFEDMFEVLPFMTVGLNTASFLSGLNLTHNTTYYVTIRATDEANKCIAVTSPGMLVNLSEPFSATQGLTVGPSESLIGVNITADYTVFVQPQQDLRIWWDEFHDPESSIDYYEVGLVQMTECGSGDSLQNVTSVTGYINTGLDRTFVFENPALVYGVAYAVEVKATDLAGLSGSVYSQPILLDSFEALPGVVKDGSDWEGDVAFQSDLSMLSGVFSHAKLPSQYPGVVLQNDPCPNTTFHSLTSEDESWSDLIPIIVGIDSLSIQYHQLQTNISTNGLRITAEYDESVKILTGAYHTDVDLSQGGIVSLDIHAALGGSAIDAELEEQSITSVVFVDSPTNNVLADFEYETRGSENPTSQEIRAAGLQIHHKYGDSEQKIVLWSISSVSLNSVVYVAHEIPSLDLSEVHTYTLNFQSEQLDTDFNHWIDLFIDGELVATLHGITKLSNNTRVVLHVFNRNGFIPNIQDTFNPPKVEAIFANISLPLQRSHICDAGRPFYSMSSPIVQFSVGIGTSPGLTDIRDLEVFSTPCRPCLPGPCFGHGCSANCTADDPYTVSFTLSNLTLSPGYHTNQSDASSGDFEFESSNTANTLLSLFTDYFQPATYFLTVQAITASGQYITSTSNGITIDITPPEQIGPIDHFDVTFSIVQPIDFQASNDTISVRWAFRDLQSGIVDYQWAIGTVPHGADIQPLTSLGTALEATNSNLLSILQHNTTYYVTITATNGAGLSTTVASDGVTYSSSVLNDTALRQSVEIEFVRSLVVGGGDGEEEEGEELLVVEKEDRAAIMWDGVSEDVEDVFWYIGTDPVSDDILPKTEVSFNDSRRAEFEDGILYLNRVAFANISDLIARAESTGERDTESDGAEKSYFVFEPGRLVYNTLELCNFVHRCVAVETLPMILIRPMDSQIIAVLGGEDVELTFTQVQGQSTEVTDRAYTVTLTTGGGVETGTVLVAGFLTRTDLAQSYRASSPYISNPYTTMTQTSPDIARRFAEVASPSFYVSVLGQDSLDGAMTINTTFDPFLDRDRFTLDIAYWDNNEELWREVSTTCGTSSVVDWTTFTISAEVCSTVVYDSASGMLGQHGQADMSGSSSGSGLHREYFSGPVQFIVVAIGNTSANTAPELLLPTEPLSIIEEESFFDYQLHYVDMEGDEVEFYITSPPLLGMANLTLDGLLSYTPCTNCTGVDSFEIFIIEKPFGFNNEPLTASGVLVVHIENVNDEPSLYAYEPLSENGTAVTTETDVQVYIESNRTSPTSISHIAALDVDGYFDDLSLSTQDGAFGKSGFEIWLDIVNILESLPVTSLPDDTFLGYVAFLAANITYLPLDPDVETDVVRVRVRDTNSALSRTLSIHIEVIPSWCLNNGVCNGSLDDPKCTDIEARRSNPESYNCSCEEGFSGQYCEVDGRLVKPVEERECPDGVPLMFCEGDPCTNAVCPSSSSAECRPNYCGTCRAEWFVGDTQVYCNADDPIVCLKPTTALACLESGDTMCDCPKQPYSCPQDSIFVETRHSECCVTFECRCPESLCPLLMEGDLGVQPVPKYRGNQFPGRCCPEYDFEDINECEDGGGNMCSDVCINKARGYSCDCPVGKTLSQNGRNCGVCIHKGREYLHGDRVQTGCNWCICQSDMLSGERWHCTARTCAASCTHNGSSFQVGEPVYPPLERVSCVCEATDTYAEWSCKAEK